MNYSVKTFLTKSSAKNSKYQIIDAIYRETGIDFNSKHIDKLIEFVSTGNNIKKYIPTYPMWVTDKKRLNTDNLRSCKKIKVQLKLLKNVKRRKQLKEIDYKHLCSLILRREHDLKILQQQLILDTTIMEAQMSKTKNRYSRYTVKRNNKVVGYLSQKDIENGLDIILDLQGFTINAI